MRGIYNQGYMRLGGKQHYILREDNFHKLHLLTLIDCILITFSYATRGFGALGGWLLVITIYGGSYDAYDVLFSNKYVKFRAFCQLAYIKPRINIKLVKNIICAGNLKLSTEVFTHYIPSYFYFDVGW